MCCKKTQIQKIEQYNLQINQLPSYDVFEIAIPIKVKNAELKKGKYRFWFNIKALNINQVLFLIDKLGGEKNIELNVLGKKIIYRKGYATRELDYFIAEIEIMQNPIPASAIFYAIIGLVGLLGAIITLEKIEKIIEVSKPFAIAVTLIVIIVLINTLGLGK